jgi:ABC-type transporter Mla subunit MlaD
MSRRPVILLFSTLAASALVPSCANKHENIVHVIAEQAPGMKSGVRVLYRGVDVGVVKQVYFTSGGVRMDLLIQRADAPIRTQDTVRIMSVGPFGAQVVDIQPGVQTAPLIAHGSTLTKVEPESTVSLPVTLWRSLIRKVGFGPESTTADSAATKRR